MKRKCKQWWSTMPLISTKNKLLPVTIKYLDSQRYMLWSLLLAVILRWEVCLILMELLTIMGWRLSFHNHISHIIVKYKKKYYWLNIFMFCKLQHGKIEIIWYLQISKVCQVVECACLDWCNLIITQSTTKYKIRESQ